MYIGKWFYLKLVVYGLYILAEVSSYLNSGKNS